MPSKGIQYKLISLYILLFPSPPSLPFLFDQIHARQCDSFSLFLPLSLCGSFVFYDGTKKSTPLGDLIREKKTMGKVFVKSPL